MLKMNSKIALLALLSSAVAGCQYKINSGTLITEEQILKVSKNVHTTEDIENLFGSPNISPDYSPGVWYYVHRDMTRRAFFAPVIKSQRVVKFTFENNVVKSIEATENNHNNDIKVIDEYIESKGTKLNPLQEYVRNFGRFNKFKKRETRR